LEFVLAKWATAKLNFLPVMHQRDGEFRKFFRQASWAYDQILRFLEVLLRIGRKDVDTVLATKKVVFAVVAV